MAETQPNVQRLQQLAESLQATLTQPLVALSKPPSAPATSSKADECAAVKLLQLQGQSKKSKASDFDYKDIHIVLQNAVKEQEEASVVAALICMLLSKGGNVNVSREISRNLLKRMKGQNQTAQRSNLLHTATIQGNVDILKVLAPHADLQSLNECIPITLKKKSLLNTEILLSHGAEASSNECQLAFTGFVRDGNHEMINLLLRSSKRPSKDCITESLPLATQQGSLDTIKLLVKVGADCRHQNASALKYAIKINRDDLTLAMLAGSKPDQLPPSTILDKMMVLTSAEQILVREALLCVGAGGPGVDTLLRLSVEEFPPERDNKLIQILVRHGASVNFDNGRCVKSAVSRGELDILRLLMPGIPSVETASQSVRLAMEIEDRVQRREIIRLLVDVGARGEPQVRDALLAAVQESPVDIAMLKTLLRQGKADINHDQGATLCYAVEYCELHVLELILRYSLPSNTTVGRAISRAIVLSPAHSDRELKIKKLLQNRTTQSSIDDALITELQTLSTIPADERSLSVLEELLHANANPNFQTGKPLCLAVQMEDMIISDLILQKRLDTASLCYCLPIAIAIQSPSLRLQTTRRLLAKGIPEDITSKELISAAHNNDLKLCRLLTEFGGSVKYQNGKCLEEASGARDARILELFLNLKPSDAALHVSFNALPSEKDRKARHAKLELLLNAGLKGETVDDALILTMRMNVPDLEVLSTFVRHGVSVNHRNGEAMVIAITSINFEAIKILLGGTFSGTTFERAFRQSWTLDRDNRLSIIAMLFEAGMPATTDLVNDALIEAVQANKTQVADRPMIKHLLAKGASPLYKNAHCLYHASQSLDFETTALLFTVPEAHSVVAKIFMSLIASSNIWRSQSGFQIFQLLLPHIVDRGIRDQALVRAVDEYITDTSELSASFLDILLYYQADVNFERGLALQKAAQQGNQGVVKKLLMRELDVDSLNMAFPYIFLSNQEESVVFSLTEVFLAQRDHGVNVDVNFQHPSLEGVLFLALEYFPGNINILRKLLDLGCNPDQKKQLIIDERYGEENTAVLCWVVFQEGRRVHSKVVDVLIEFDANSNFMTKKSWTTPLLVAAEVGSQVLVFKLLQAGARADVENRLGESPLAFASRRGDLDMMAALIGSGTISRPGTKINDGSLHDAARNLQTDAIRLLVHNNHNLNFPSERHNGRSVLGELCNKAAEACGPSSPAIERELEITIQLVVDAGADFKRQYGSKSVLHLALDSSNPLPTTRALLKSIMYNYINEDFNLYTDSNGIVYSPTMYVLKGQFEGPRDQEHQLWTLLSRYQSKDIWYDSNVGATQPEGWKGAPLEVIAEEERKRRREIRILETREEVTIDLDNERLVAAQAEALKRAAHDLDVSHATSFAQKKLEMQAEADSAREAAAQRQRQAEIKHMQHVTTHEIQREATLGQTRLEIHSKENRMQIEYQSEREAKALAALSARMGSERNHRAELNRIDEAAAEKRLDMMKRGARLINQAASRAESGPMQRLLTYSVEEAD